MTDRPSDCLTDNDRAFAPRLLQKERLDDARYAIRAWVRGFPWLALFGCLGAALTAISQGDYLALATSLTAVVLVFWPRANAKIVYEVIRTDFIRRKLLARPAGDFPERERGG